MASTKHDLETVPKVLTATKVRGAIGPLRAESAHLHQSAAQEITADRADLASSAALRVRGSLIEAKRSLMGLAKSNELWLCQGAAAIVQAENASLDGYAGVVAANKVQLGRATALVVAGRQIHGERIQALMVVGNRVEGEVHTLLDTRQALMVGLLGGLFAGLILSLTRVLFRRE